jgi:hypothetical protein
MVGLCWSQALVILDYDGMRELIPIIDIVQSLAVAEGRQTGVVNIKDNSGALVLAKTFCHHNSRHVVSITQQRLFGFVRKLQTGNQAS